MKFCAFDNVGEIAKCARNVGIGNWLRMAPEIGKIYADVTLISQHSLYSTLLYLLSRMILYKPDLWTDLHV